MSALEAQHSTAKGQTIRREKPSPPEAIASHTGVNQDAATSFDHSSDDRSILVLLSSLRGKCWMERTSNEIHHSTPVTSRYHRDVGISNR